MNTKSKKLLQLLARLPLMARVALCGLLAAALALACGWDPPRNSVRFSGYTERYLSRLPPLPNSAYGADVHEPKEVTTPDELAEEVDTLWATASEAEQSEAWDKLRAALRRYLEATEIKTWGEYDALQDAQARRNSAVDRWDALTALAQGVKSEDVTAYLTARAAFDDAEKWVEAATILDAVPQHRSLQDNVAYLRAAVKYKEGDYPAAFALFQENAARYPRSEKREANQFMAALAARHASEEESQTADTALRLEWKNKAINILQNFHRDYPASRYADDARSDLAYLWLQGGEEAKALAEYYRLLGSPRLSTRLAAAHSLTLVRGDAPEQVLAQVEEDLADEPEAALAYCYHTIYNYLPHVADWYDEEERNLSTYISRRFDGAQKLADVRDKKEQDRQRMLDFATRMLQRYPNRQLGGGFTLRLAMAQMEMGREREALTLARRALQSGVSGAEQHRALLLQGAAAHRARDFKAARRTLTGLLKQNPDARITERARRVLAMAAEDDGDLGAALEQYFELGYDSDAAYFADVLMTPEQLAGFIRQHPAHPRHETLVYSLGVRYLRAGRWQEAQQTLESVKVRPGVCEYESDYDDSLLKDPKQATRGYYCDEGGYGLTSAIIMRDTQTARDLEAWEKTVASAPSDEARAEALYQYASYVYSGSKLKFYNPAIWHGTRYDLLSFLDYSNGYRQPGEADTVWRYMQEQDTPARAIPLYLQVVDRYPQTRAAPDALYTAAVAHERQSSYNDYWREMYGRGMRAGPRLVSYADVTSAYPKYRFPRGTYGWEPGPRTVNGGPAYTPPPKPRPPLTRSQYLKVAARKGWDMVATPLVYYAGRAWAWAGGVWRGTLYPWLMRLILLLSAFALWRTAQRTRGQIKALGLTGPDNWYDSYAVRKWWRALDIATRRLVAHGFWLYATLVAVTWEALLWWWG